MACTITREGTYELFRTSNHNRILVLDDQYFAIVEGQKGELLVGTDSDHEKDETLKTGSFKLVEFDNDARFQDTPHLFLEHGDHYDEAILPRGLPSGKGEREKYIYTDHHLAIDDLDQYLNSPRSGEGSERRERPGGGSMANIVYYLKGTDFPVNKESLLRHARESDAPSEVIEQLQKLDEQSFDSMADLSQNLGKNIQKERPPIEDYDRKNVDQILSAMDDLDREGIEKLRDYEKAHHQRKMIRRKATQFLEDEEAPVENYFDLTAKALIEEIREMEPAELEKLEAYESEHKNRKTVLEAIEAHRNRS